MKKLLKITLPIILVIAILTTFAGCGGKLPENYKTVTDIQGLTFAMPSDIADKEANNLEYTAFVYSGTANKSNEYIYKDNLSYYYLIPNKLEIVVEKVSGFSGIARIEEPSELADAASYLEGFKDVSCNSYSKVNLSTIKVTGDVAVLKDNMGDCKGKISFLDDNKGNVVRISVLYTDAYMQEVGADVAKSLCKNVIKSIEITGDPFSYEDFEDIDDAQPQENVPEENTGKNELSKPNPNFEKTDDIDENYMSQVAGDDFWG